ncbi:MULTISPECIES: WecB/TagA/CpsF family glycosyltransferase [unclassified Carboxylicivirga]|uniref:WecB/TagA/CpsF family glycosyltransferase n=1 Tax=Carboxylicivirga TaxID=1628153 RepID=UPI003D32E20B
MNLEKNRITDVNLFSIPIAAVTMQQTVARIAAAIETNTELQHVVVNAGKIVAMQTDAELRDSVLDADLINADGQAVVWASKILGQPLPERVAGIDLMLNLVKMAHEKGLKCYFLGAKEEVVKKVIDVFSKTYSPDVVAGYRNGYFKGEDEEQIARDIAASGAQLLFVAISSPKKEIFVNKYKSIMKVPFVMGVGGSFDVVAGVTKRAPLWMQKVGLEWFYRFAQEPKRMWKRYLVGNSKFIWLVLKERFKKNR